MAGLVALLGEKLVGQSGDVNTADALSGKKAIALYFSAHWCPPCKGFTPKLAEWYKANLKEKGLEIVFVSSDKDDTSFKDYFGEMPWLALPYADRDRKEALSKKFKVKGIPSVVIIDSDGSTLNLDGRSAISSDPTGEDMPWKPPTFEEVFADMTLINSDGSTSKGSSMKGKVFGIYFSAHWCPPCRGFTPKLAEWYAKDLKGKGFEVVFASSDKDQGQFDSYFKEMPWLALDFADRKGKEKLSNVFGVEGIPSFVILDKDFSVITKDGRAAVTSDPTGSELPWYPKPVKNLKDGPGDIQEAPTILALCETADKAVQDNILSVLTPFAKKFVDEAKAKDEEYPEVSFTIVTSAEGLSSKVRGMMKLEALPPSKHEHPLEKKESANGWGCDGCSQSGAGKDRYRCTQGCDFDLCGECHAKCSSDGYGEAPAFPPKLMLIDIPDNGAYYEGPTGDVTSASVEKLLADYKSKAIERKQL